MSCNTRGRTVLSGRQEEFFCSSEFRKINNIRTLKKKIIFEMPREHL